MKPRVVAAVAAPLLWNNWLLPRLALNHRGRTAANTVAASGYALVFGGRPNWRSGSGARIGCACAAVVAVGYLSAVAVPAVRRSLATAGERAAEVGTLEWVTVHIPLGTVYTEELIFRGTLDPLLDREFGARTGTVLGSVAFGLWHIFPARAAGDNVLGTVAFTSAAGLAFGTLCRWTGSATASALPHWAVNAGGVLITRLRTGSDAVAAGPGPLPSGRRRRDSDRLRR